MTSIDKESLCLLNPIFKISRVQILWDDEVLEVETNGHVNSRVCLIATTGIYIIQKKAFPHPAKITNFIPYTDISSIAVIQNRAIFTSCRTEIQIKHLNVSPFAFIAYCIREAQFPISILPLKMDFPNDDQFSLINESSPYQPSSIFMDRLISCALHLKIDVTPLLLKTIQNELVIVDSTFKITVNITQSPLFPAVMLSLPYDLDLKKIVIDSCQLSIVFARFDEIFLRSKAIQEILFINCDFSGCLTHFRRLSAINKPFQPSKWVFKQITVNDAFISFFEALDSLSSDIQSLSFQECHFSAESMPAIFQSFFFNSCFHHLESFSFDKIPDYFDLPLQIASLTCCNWVMQSKCLHYISMSFCGLNADTTIPQLMNFDTGLQVLKIAGCKFLSPLVFKTPPVLNHITHLDLHESKFTAESLLSLFNVVQNKTFIIDEINLSGIKFEHPEQSSVFYSKIVGMKIESLTTLIYNNNHMNELEATQFASFISLQSNLHYLSVNNSILTNQSMNGARHFLDALENLNLTCLSIRSDKSADFSFGRLLTNVFPKLFVKGIIKHLDLTGQLLNDEGLEALEPFLSEISGSKLEYLYIDGTGASYRRLCDFCEVALSSPLRIVTYPKNDFDQAIKKFDENTATTLRRNADDLLNRFTNRFIKKTVGKFWFHQSTQENLLLRNDTSQLKKHDESIPGLDAYPISAFFKDSINQRDSEIKNLFNEVYANNSNQKKEAILEYLDQLDDELSFARLIKQVEGR